MIELLECTCIEAYKARKMRDPNCCACSCDHNDLVEQLAKVNERVEKLGRMVSDLELVCAIGGDKEWQIKLNKFAIEQKIEAFEKAQIPRKAKAGCIGEFNFTIEDGVCCPECWNEQSDDCHMCNGKSNERGLSDLTASVPWDLCKEIWLRMNKIYAEQLRKEQQND